MSSALRLALSASRLAVFLIALVTGHPQVAAAASTEISLVPATAVVQPGAHMNIEVQLSTEVQVRGIQFMLRYDPHVLHIDGVYDGTFFSNWAAQNGAHAQTVFPFTPDNEKGVTTVGGVALFGGPATAGPVGSGSVVTIQVTVPPDVADGATTSIEFDKLILANTQAREVSGAVATGATLRVAPPGVTAPPVPTPFVVPQVSSPQTSFTDAGMVWARRNTTFIGIIGGGLLVAAVVYALVMRVGRPGHALVVTLCVLAAGSLSVTPAHAANTAVTLSPPTVAANPGDQLKLDVVLSSDVATRGMQFGLTFDPSVLQIDKVVDGTFYQSWASAHGAMAQTVVPFKPNNTKGTVSVGGVAILGGPPTDGPSGSGVVVTLQITAKSGAQGVAQLAFTSVIVDDANSKEIPAVASTGAAVGVGVDASSIGGPTTAQALPPASTDIQFRLPEGGQPSSQSVQLRNGTPVTDSSESAPTIAAPVVAPTPVPAAPTLAPAAPTHAPVAAIPTVASAGALPAVGTVAPRQAAASLPTSVSQGVSLAAVPTVGAAPVQVGGAQAFQAISTPIAAQPAHTAAPQVVAATPTLARLPGAAPVAKPRGTAGVFLPWELLAGIGGGLVTAGLVLLAVRVHERGAHI